MTIPASSTSVGRPPPRAADGGIALRPSAAVQFERLTSAPVERSAQRGSTMIEVLVSLALLALILETSARSHSVITGLSHHALARQRLRESTASAAMDFRRAVELSGPTTTARRDGRLGPPDVAAVVAWRCTPADDLTPCAVQLRDETLEDWALVAAPELRYVRLEFPFGER